MAAAPLAPSIRDLPERQEWGPAVYRRALGEHLRRCREFANVSRRSAAHHIRVSNPTYGRMEKGEAPLHKRDVLDLAHLFGITHPGELQAHSVFVEGASKADPWQDHRDTVSPWFRPLLSMEPAAELIHTYEPHLVPGWLQTEEYARAVTRAGNPTASASWIEQRAALRARRLKMFFRAVDPPHLLAVMDESVLNRVVGNPGVMHRQIRHLVDLLEQLPYELNVQVAPLSMGAVGAIGHPVVHLRFREALLPDAVYLEQSETALYSESAKKIERYRGVLHNLSAQAKSVEDTRSLLLEALKNYH